MTLLKNVFLTAGVIGLTLDLVGIELSLDSGDVALLEHPVPVHLSCHDSVALVRLGLTTTVRTDARVPADKISEDASLVVEYV